MVATLNSEIIAPADSLRVVVPHVSADLPDGVCRALWVGSSGDLVVVAENDTDAVTITGIQTGTLIPIRAKAVRSSTSASAIVALY